MTLLNIELIHISITSYEELKTLLRSHFGKPYSVPFLQLKLNSLRQEKGESIDHLLVKYKLPITIFQHL